MNPDSSIGRRHPKLKTRLKELARDQILAAAEQTFAADGLHRARMETIARRVGVAVGTLYNHFKDRDALFNALLEARRVELIHRLDVALEGSTKLPFEAQLEAFYGAAFDHFEQHEAFMRVSLEAEMGHGPSSKKLMDEVRKRAVALVARGIKAGAVRQADAYLFGPMLLGTVKVALLRRLREEDHSNLREEIPRLIRFFLDGVGAR